MSVRLQPDVYGLWDRLPIHSRQRILFQTATQELNLPAPEKSHIKFSKVIDWPEGAVPIAPAGFVAGRFAEGIKSSHNMIVWPNGDVCIPGQFKA